MNIKYGVGANDKPGRKPAALMPKRDRKALGSRLQPQARHSLMIVLVLLLTDRDLPDGQIKVTRVIIVKQHTFGRYGGSFLGRFTLTLLTGALMACSTMASASTLVVNGDFETGDFTGWTQSGNTGFTGVDNAAHSGNFGASFGPVGSHGFLTQTLTTIAGSSYDLNFWLTNDGGTPSFASVSFDGTELMSMTDPGGFGYQLFSYSVVASSATADLQFAFQQNPAFFHLDDISVTAAATETPEPATAAVMFLGVGALMIYRKRQSSLQQ